MKTIPVREDPKHAEWLAMAQQPEALTTGQLNAAVRFLRERLHEQAVKSQTAIEQLTGERDAARAVILDTVSDMDCEPECYADPFTNPNGDHAENCPVAYPAEAWRRLRAEVAKLRKVTGPDCPSCGFGLKLHRREQVFVDDIYGSKLVPGFELYRWSLDCGESPAADCRITVADLIANHPAIAREMGVSE